jgi:hypothetical protein
LDQPPVDGENLTADQLGSIFDKIRFSWRPEDSTILTRLKAHVDEEFADNFADAVEVLDRFYASMRVPQTHVIDGQVMPVLDAQRRQVWVLNERGRPKEDYSLLTGQDLEEAILGLERVRLAVVPRVSELLSDAIFAKMGAGDIHDDTWDKVMDGTMGDKSARSNRDNRVERYHAFFRYSLWLMSKDFLDEIGRFMDWLGKIRTWKSFEK